jgi:hypothetical protein
MPICLIVMGIFVQIRCIEPSVLPTNGSLF